MTEDYVDTIFCPRIWLIDSHVLRFFGAFHIFLAITSTFGNAVILAALIKESSLHPPSKILLRSLALTDLYVGILSEPVFAVNLIAADMRSSELCIRSIDFLGFLTEVLSLASLFTLTAIGVERFLALSLGLRYRQVVTVKRVVVILIFLWILSIGLATTVFWYRELNFFYTVISNFLCIIVSSFCYIKIYRKLAHHQTQIQEHAHQGQPDSNRPLKIARYRKTVSSTLWIQFSVLACYLPMGIVMVLIRVKGVGSSLLFAWIVTTTLLLMNSTLNPILYCWKIREVRQDVKEIIRKLISCC